MTTKALVTGGTGFLGKALALRLVGLGFEVTVLGRNEAVGGLLTAKGVRFVRGDLASPETVQAVCQKQDAVFHCGALSAPWGPYRDFYRANVLGTRVVIDGCRRHQVSRLIHVSTASVYFDYQDRLNIPESSPLPAQPCNHYARTKRLAEALVEQAAGQGLPAITIRPRAIFGPGDPSLLPRIIRANRRGTLPLIDDGVALVDITDVDNVVDALIACLDAPVSAQGRKFNITNGQPATLRDILTRLFALLGEPPRFRPLSYAQASRLAERLELASRLLTLGRLEPPLTRYKVGVLGKSQTLDITAARQCLGYRPAVSVEDGLSRYAAWWKEQAT